MIVFAGGIVLAIAQPGDLGGKTSTSQGARPTTTTTSTTVNAQSSAPPSSSSSTAASSSSTTATTAPSSATTTTTKPGGLGQSGAGGTGTGQHPVTGGTSMLWLGALLAAAAFVVRRALSGATARA